MTWRQQVSLPAHGHSHHIRSQYKLLILSALSLTNMLVQYGVNPREAGIRVLLMKNPKLRPNGVPSPNWIVSHTLGAGQHTRRRLQTHGIQMRHGDRRSLLVLPRVSRAVQEQPQSEASLSGGKCPRAQRVHDDHIDQKKIDREGLAPNHDQKGPSGPMNMKTGSPLKLHSILLLRQKHRRALHSLHGKVEATPITQGPGANHIESLIVRSPRIEAKIHHQSIYGAAQILDIRARAQGQCPWYQMLCLRS